MYKIGYCRTSLRRFEKTQTLLTNLASTFKICNAGYGTRWDSGEQRHMHCFHCLHACITLANSSVRFSCIPHRVYSIHNTGVCAVLFLFMYYYAWLEMIYVASLG